MTRFALVADLGGTKIAAARVEDTGRITHQLKTATPREGGLAVVDAIIRILQRLPGKDVSVIGAGVPGLAYPNGIVWAPNISGWEHMPLSKALKFQFKLPVLVESDRNAFVTGEAWKGAAQNCSDVIFLAIGTGIGAGIISGGRLIRGHAELAGCVGWMAVRDQFLSVYKRVGCLESHVAGPGIAQAAQRMFRQSTNTREVIRLAHRGDPKAKRIVSQSG
ncbi:MAG: ROK family protein, partial [Terriglobia bacterium]